jgi:hypothetical protein
MTETATLIALWEAGQGQARGRATRLLAAAGEADPAGLTLGEAARRLLALRARLVGETLACLASCPSCGEVNAAAIATDALTAAGAEPGPVAVEVAGWRATARQLTLGDLDDAAAAPDLDTATALLRDRAILAVERPGGIDGNAPMPEALVMAIESELDAADALADASMAFTCAGCGTGWDTAFDPAAFLAQELGAKARRSLAEVATLARSYGWSEADILAMPAARRRIYLELAG